MQPKTLEIIVPVYNEESNISLIFTEVEILATSILPYAIQLTFVDNASTDKTIEIINKLANLRHSYKCKLIRLSRNFGKESSLSAGLDFSTGDFVIPVDADLQDPIQLIPEMLREFERNFDIDIVVAVRRSREDNFSRKILAKLFVAVFNRLSENKLYKNSGEYQLMTKRYVDSFKKIKESERFVRGIFSWLGFKAGVVSYDRPNRMSGKSSYSYYKLVKLALNAIFSHSVKPLRFSLVMAFIFSLLFFIYLLYIVYLAFTDSILVPGYSSIVVLILLTSSIQMLLIGIIGEYLGKTLLEAKKRPTYILKEIEHYG